MTNYKPCPKCNGTKLRHITISCDACAEQENNTHANSTSEPESEITQEQPATDLDVYSKAGDILGRAYDLGHHGVLDGCLVPLLAELESWRDQSISQARKEEREAAANQRALEAVRDKLRDMWHHQKQIEAYPLSSYLIDEIAKVEAQLIDALSGSAVVSVNGPDYWRNCSQLILAVSDESLPYWKELVGKDLPDLTEQEVVEPDINELASLVYKMVFILEKMTDRIERLEKNG